MGNNRTLVTAAGSSVGIFVVDLLTPPDLAVCVLYLTVLLMVPVRLPEMSMLTGIGVVFTVIGGFVGTVQGDPDMVWINRALVIVALIGCATILALWAGRSARPAVVGDGRITLDPPAIATAAVASPAAALPTSPVNGTVRIATVNLRLLNALADRGPRTTAALRDELLDCALPDLHRGNIDSLVDEALARLEEGGLIEPTAGGRWALARTGVARTAPTP